MIVAAIDFEKLLVSASNSRSPLHAVAILEKVAGQ